MHENISWSRCYYAKAIGNKFASRFGKGVQFVGKFHTSRIGILFFFHNKMLNILMLTNHLSIQIYRKKNIQRRCFYNKQLNIFTFKNVIDWIDERLIDWRHYISEESRIVRLDEDERGQAPNSGHESKI